MKILFFVALLGAASQSCFAAQLNPPVSISFVGLGFGSTSDPQLFNYRSDFTLRGSSSLSEDDGFPSITTDGASIYLNTFSSTVINRYSPAGDFQGTVADLGDSFGGTGFLIMESDSNRELFVARTGSSSRPRTSFRLDTSGNTLASFSHPDLVFPVGIDSTGGDDVFIVNGAAVGVGNKLFQFDHEGAFVAIHDLPELRSPSDIAIDEANQQLFISDFFAEVIHVYDLASGSPVFSHSIAAPEDVNDIFFDPILNRVLGVGTERTRDTNGNIVSVESVAFLMATDGSNYQTLDFPLGIQPVGIVATVPEPSSILLSLSAIFGMTIVLRLKR